MLAEQIFCDRGHKNSACVFCRSLLFFFLLWTHDRNRHSIKNSILYFNSINWQKINETNLLRIGFIQLSYNQWWESSTRLELLFFCIEKQGSKRPWSYSLLPAIFVINSYTFKIWTIKIFYIILLNFYFHTYGLKTSNVQQECIQVHFITVCSYTSLNDFPCFSSLGVAESRCFPIIPCLGRP